MKMIKIEIEIEEIKSKIQNERTISSNVKAEVNVLGQDETRAEKQVKDLLLERAGLNKNFEMVDKTNDKRYEEIGEKINEIMKGLK